MVFILWVMYGDTFVAVRFTAEEIYSSWENEGHE
jgi:hypothetical protein